MLWVRHGVTPWNRSKRAQGHADIDLDAEGKRQAEVVAAELAAFDITAVYSSDLARAVHTAEPIARKHNLPLEVDAGFREIDQGEWTGLDPDAISKRWPGLWARRSWCPRPGGESPTDVLRRAGASLERVVSEHPAGTIVVVTHGGLIRWVSAEALGYTDGRAARIKGLSNGGVVTMDAHLEDGRVVLRNLVRLDGRSPAKDDPNA